MNNYKCLNRTEIVHFIISSLEDLLSQTEEPFPDPLEESTHLIGRQSIVDSLKLVTLIVDLEQQLEEEYGVSITIADERAMSQKNSPFRTVQSLADYIYTLVEEEYQS